MFLFHMGQIRYQIVFLVGLNCELLVTLNQWMTFFYKRPYKLAFIKCMINRIVLTAIKTFVIRFNTIFTKLLFGNYNSVDKFKLEFLQFCFLADVFQRGKYFFPGVPIQLHCVVPSRWASLVLRVNFIVK